MYQTYMYPTCIISETQSATYTGLRIPHDADLDEVSEDLSIKGANNVSQLRLTENDFDGRFLL